MPTSNPNTVVGAAVTRLVAGLRRKANNALAADANARADYFDAVGRAAKSYIGMNQAIGEIGELDEILALDREERAAGRAERKQEIEHRKAVSELRRKQELTEAQRKSGGRPSTWMLKRWQRACAATPNPKRKRVEAECSGSFRRKQTNLKELFLKRKPTARTRQGTG
jgi:hypothetical protein